MGLTLRAEMEHGDEVVRGEVFMDTAARFCKLAICPLHKTNQVVGFGHAGQ